MSFFIQTHRNIARRSDGPTARRPDARQPNCPTADLMTNLDENKGSIVLADGQINPAKISLLAEARQKNIESSDILEKRSCIVLIFSSSHLMLIILSVVYAINLKQGVLS